MLPLTPNLKLVVEYDSKYDTCIKVQLGTLWIAFSEFQWLRIREHVPRLRNADYSLKLSERKYVTNKLFPLNNVHYISFSNVYKNKEGKLADSFINFSPDEWQLFLDKLVEMDKLFPPKKLKSCPDCVLQRVKVNEVGRTKDTVLDDDKLKAVLDNNDTTYNQEAHRCTYCGGFDMSCDCEECHCHKFNCHECEKDNFCKTCRKLQIEAI